MSAGGRRTGSEGSLAREIGAWLRSQLGRRPKRELRVKLSRSDSSTVLLDFAVTPASLAAAARQIEATALETERHLGPQTFVLRCSGGKDTLGTKHFTARAKTDGMPAQPVTDLWASAATLLRHYEKVLGAQAAELARLEGRSEPPHRSPAGPGVAPRPGPDSTAAPEVAEKIGLLLPIIANAIAAKFGLDVSVPAPSPEQELARALFASLSEEQLGTLLQVLRPEQMAALQALRERCARHGTSERSEPAASSGSAVSPDPDEAERSVPN